MHEHGAAPAADTRVAIAAPLQLPERIAFVDILRGFALGGILAANMADFTSPFYYVPLSALWPELHNRIALALVQLFVSNNFFTIFSFLFGLGLALQMMRLEARGVRFVPIYLRRQGILFCIGAAHGLLIWYGDILAPYALFGCLLLLFRRQSPARLLVLASGLVLAPIGLSVLRMTAYAGIAAASAQHTQADGMDAALRVISIYAHGSWLEIFRLRAHELMINYNGWIGRNYGVTVFAMFLLGLSAGRLNIFGDMRPWLPLARSLWMIGLACLLLAAAGTLADGVIHGMPPALDLGFYQFMKIAHIFISFFYISSLMLLAQRPRIVYWLSFLAAPGRMALTNYLLQSVFFTTLFNSYGLGVFGAISPAAGLMLTVIFFSAQIVMSNWFLSRFRFGPVEWMWKSLTYGKRQPFIIAQRTR
jgi:uncharacterized protein